MNCLNCRPLREHPLVRNGGRVGLESYGLWSMDYTVRHLCWKCLKHIDKMPSYIYSEPLYCKECFPDWGY